MRTPAIKYLDVRELFMDLLERFPAVVTTNIRSIHLNHFVNALQIEKKTDEVSTEHLFSLVETPQGQRIIYSRIEVSLDKHKKANINRAVTENSYRTLDTLVKKHFSLKPTT